jgi:hypothetical protein
VAQALWCWRCRKVLPMLEPHEWAVVEEARAAGAQYVAVLARARANLPAGHDFTPLPPHAGASSQRIAPLPLTYELFTGLRARPLEILHHRTSLYGPPCHICEKPLRTPTASWCAACGQRRAQVPTSGPTLVLPPCVPGQVRLHVPRLSTMTIADVLDGPLPPDEWDIFPSTPHDVFLHALANSALGLVHHAVTFRLVDPMAVPSESARMVQGLFKFRLAVLGDTLFDYLREEADGNDLPDVVRWCEAIGALRAQSLAQTLLDLYPPELRDDPRGRGEYLNDIDDREGHEVPQRIAETRWDDVLEIPERLRAYVGMHRSTFEAALLEGRSIGHRAQELLRDMP